MTTLTRTKLTPSVAKPCDDFAREVSEKLGYSELAKEYASGEANRQLETVLMELEIAPFDARAVNAYKEDAVIEARRPSAKSVLSWYVGATVLALSVGSFVGSITWGMSCVKSGDNPLWPIILLVVSVVTAFISRCLLSQLQTIEANWRQCDISDYLLPIPKFALETALAIKGRLPESYVSVQYLRVNYVVNDPFLVVQAKGGDRSYYVEVWDEPGFNVKRMV